uniref:Uncharacterized protein n=1 Tax=Podoviridae sp. ctBev14 TaxID=2823556 RepID=A0A8S5LAX7_9CAUD|nr:MAG TPA: hypothetical protein [Podoviridae sp. ctBev14]DAX34562.1 MAG TPA: hypothetical protein [Caudoviricetes sp.]
MVVRLSTSRYTFLFLGLARYCLHHYMVRVSPN